MRAFAVVCLVLSSATTIAAADVAAREESPVRLVLISPPAPLETAVRTALAPWRVVIVVERSERPDDVAEAGTLAVRHHADAVAWLSPGEMVVFDRIGADIVHRPVGEINEVSAAALALTLKTLLRLPPLPPPPPPEEEASPDLAPEMTVVAPAPSEPKQRPWRVEVVAGGRLRDGSIEPRVTAIGERALGPIAVAISVAAGSGEDVIEGPFTGTWSDVAAGAGVRVPFWFALSRGALRLAPGAGLSLHHIGLRGDTMGKANGNQDEDEDGDVDVDIAYDLVGLDSEVGLSWVLGPVSTGARLATSVFPSRRTYPVRNNKVLELSVYEVELGLFASVSF